MILDDIKKKLEEIDVNVFYGMADSKMNETIWDYIVFNRGPLKPSENRTGYSQIYSVHLVRENFVPEELVFELIDKMREIPGMRTEGEGSFDYVPKPNTNIVVEMFSMNFAKPRKK